MKPPITYRWRAECEVDGTQLVELILLAEFVSFVSVRIDAFPDMVCTLKVRSLTLRQLRQLMRKVPDSHVMVKTVQPIDRYTGKRNPEF